MTNPIDSTPVIPHRGKMKLIGDVLDFSDGWGLVAARLESSSMFVKPNGEVEQIVAIELIAQAVAAFNVFESFQEDKPPANGYLVSVDKAEFYAAITSNEDLVIEVNLDCKIGDFQIFNGQLRFCDKLLAEVAVKVWSASIVDGV